MLEHGKGEQGWSLRTRKAKKIIVQFKSRLHTWRENLRTVAKMEQNLGQIVHHAIITEGKLILYIFLGNITGIEHNNMKNKWKFVKQLRI